MDDERRGFPTLVVEGHHGRAGVGDDELGGHPLDDAHLLLAAQHVDEVLLRLGLQHVPFQDDPVAHSPSGRHVLRLVRLGRDRRGLVGDEDGDLLDRTELQLVEPLGDSRRADDDLHQVLDVAGRVGAMHLGQLGGGQLRLVELVSALVEEDPQRHARWRGHPAIGGRGRLGHQAALLERHGDLVRCGLA